jgi:hypothetical protein
MKQHIALALFAFAALAGCAGDPDLAASTEALEIREVERARWELALPGCEDAELDSAELRRCAGEPLLGALVDFDGHVVCVDSISLLQAETRAVRLPTAGALSDPTPTPLSPIGGRWDPTPTPLLQE